MARNRLWWEATAEADIQRFYDEKVVTRLATSLHRNITDGALLPGSIHMGRPALYLGREPVVIPVVDLEAGARMMSNLVDVEPDPAKIACDMPVAVGMIDEAVAPGQGANR